METIEEMMREGKFMPHLKWKILAKIRPAYYRAFESNVFGCMNIKVRHLPL